MISLNLSARHSLAHACDSILLMAHALHEFSGTTQAAAETFRQMRSVTSRYVAAQLRKLPHDRRLVYWRERQAGAWVLEALAVATRGRNAK